METSNTVKNIRYEWIDILRGIAVSFMIVANYISLLEEPYTVLFRIFVSNIAPLFITLSAGMVILSSQYHKCNYYICRGFYILLIAAIIDVFSRSVMPFYSFDVLYIIGIGLPIAYLCKNLNIKILLSLTLICFCISVVLQKLYGYDAEILEVSLVSPHLVGFGSIMRSFFINGWFPFFPWVGYVFFGVAFFKHFFCENKQDNKLFIIIISTITICICYLFLFFKFSWAPKFISPDMTKYQQGYAGLFFPVSLSILLSSLGFIVLLTYFIKSTSKFKFLKVFKKFGEYSMLIYILHDVIFFRIILPIFDFLELPLITSWKIYAILILFVACILYLVCILIDYIKKFCSPKNTFVQVIIGK